MSLRDLSEELGVSQRTLRRAADVGLIRGQRVSARQFHVPMREEQYLRRHWPLLGELRSALRTEPNVRMAVLFGSAARGDLREHSDIDLLVSLKDDAVRGVAALSHRLGERTGRPVQPVRLTDAEARPALLVDVLTDGRVLIDRDGGWPELLRRRPSIERRAAREAVSLEDALATVPLLADNERT